MKQLIQAKLTSSKNERKAFEVIYNRTIGRGKGYQVIKDKHFIDGGLKHRNRRNEAVLRLIKKGLVFRHEEDCYWRGGEGRIFGYSVRKFGCVRFLIFNDSPCFDCLKHIGIKQ